MAIADLDQKAEQDNDNEMSAEGTEVGQGQGAIQFNLNVQAAAAIASADSGDVSVWQSGGLHAGTGGVTGDGITAELEGGGGGHARAEGRAGQREQRRS